MSNSKENRQEKIRIIGEIHLLSFRLARFPDTVIQTIPMPILKNVKARLEEQVFRLLDPQGDVIEPYLHAKDDDVTAKKVSKKSESQESEKNG